MNGLLRQYFPKGTDLRAYTAADLAIVADEINHRPRKTLDWATPAGLFDDLLSLTSGVSSAGAGSMPRRVAVVRLEVNNLKAARQLVAPAEPITPEAGHHASRRRSLQQEVERG